MRRFFVKVVLLIGGFETRISDGDRLETKLMVEMLRGSGSKSCSWCV
jgi:hypothetical protein